MHRTHRLIGTFAASLLTLTSASLSGQTLEKFSRLPADTFAPGPTSGQFITAANGRVPPFVAKQPIQGFSAVLKGPAGDYWGMPDNGFGAKENSVDYVLRLYRLSPDFRTKNGGSGITAVTGFISLSDPDRRIPFPIVADGATYPGSAIAVDPAIRQARLLTGGDFDIESVRIGRDGTLWFGDEFGPFLLHTDASGRMLEAPISLPGVRSPQNPFLAGSAPTLPRSKGFEGMAISSDGGRLYPMLEGALIADADQRRLIINEFDVAARRYTGRQWFYRLEAPSPSGQSIGDMTAVTNHSFLIIERDNFEGPAAAFKKVFLVDFNHVDASGFLVKRQVADLLNIADPDSVGGFGPTFRFPFQTIESVLPLGRRRLAILNDNNYPFSAGRIAGQPDPNEFIVIRLDQPLSDRGEGRADDAEDERD